MTMPEITSSEALKGLDALAQASRLAIFQLIVTQGPTGLIPTKIAESLDLARATVSFHLQALAGANLVQTHREGNFIFYSANLQAVDALIEYLSQHCGGTSSRSAGGTQQAVEVAMVPSMLRSS